MADLFPEQKKHHFRGISTDVSEDVLGRCSHLSTPL